MIQILINPTDVVFRKSQHEYAHWVGGPLFDVVATDDGEIVGYMLLEAQRGQLYMKLKDQIGYETFLGYQTTRGAIDSLAAQLNLAVDWGAMGANL